MRLYNVVLSLHVIDYVSRIINYVYHYLFLSRLLVSVSIREVIYRLNLVFLPAAICPF